MDGKSGEKKKVGNRKVRKYNMLFGWVDEKLFYFVEKKNKII